MVLLVSFPFLCGRSIPNHCCTGRCAASAAQCSRGSMVKTAVLPYPKADSLLPRSSAVCLTPARAKQETSHRQKAPRWLLAPRRASTSARRSRSQSSPGVPSWGPWRCLSDRHCGGAETSALSPSAAWQDQGIALTQPCQRLGSELGRMRAQFALRARPAPACLLSRLRQLTRGAHGDKFSYSYQTEYAPKKNGWRKPWCLLHYSTI